MQKFTNECLDEVFSYLIKNLEYKNTIKIEVLNPDLALEAYAGEIVKLDVQYIYRSYRNWNDLASILFCKLLTPKIKSENTIELEFYKLNKKESFHINEKNSKEKYGLDSSFSRINKNEEASFYFYYKQALENAKIKDKNIILNLGVNKADEFDMIKKVIKNEEDFFSKKYIGIDYSRSAIAYAKKKFPQDNFSFFSHDINTLDELNLPKADFLISIGTLQSTSLNFKEIFMKIIQSYLKNDASIILGFPNCRWINSEMLYGAKAPNYGFSEQSILYKDVYFCKKYLQSKKYRVTLTGKEYLFLTATSIRK